MVDMVNVGVPQVANRAFLPLAVEAGIVAVIQSLVPLATDKLSLLFSIKQALENSNPALANALNTQTLDAILAYMETLPSAFVVSADKLPSLENEAGPASVAAARDGGVPTQVNITYSAPPEEYTSEIYFDGVFRKHSMEAGSNGWVNEALANIPVDGQQHTIRVLFRTPDGNVTRFGPIVTFN